MKVQKQLLSLEEFEDDLTIGLVRLVKMMPDFELFYHFNHFNHFCLSRIEDLITIGHLYNHRFSQFQGYHHETKTCFRFLSNKSSESIKKNDSLELFSEESDIKFLLSNYQDVDYIITTSDVHADFSLILLPENLMFQIQEFCLSSKNELYKIIQYYE